MWKSQFLIVLPLRVMNSQLSIQEYNEPVTKGFLVGYLSEQEYVTRISLQEILESKNYATKEYVYDMFVMFRKLINEDFAHHTNALVEMIQHQHRGVTESIIGRIERIERHVGLESF